MFLLATTLMPMTLDIEVRNIVLKTLFFKFIGLMWMILCGISQFVYFTASYTGSLERVLVSVKLSPECANYCRKMAAIYTAVAWILWFINFAFLVYAIFFTEGYMDMIMAPITTYINPSNLLPARMVAFVVNVHIAAAWTFPHAVSLTFATVFSYQYQELDRILEEKLLDSNELRVSDMEIETLRQRHQKISIAVREADKFLKFSNAGAFCCQLFNTILLLYALIFYSSTMPGPIIVIKRVFWMVGQSMGLSVTAAGGIMVNHYVSTNVYFFVVFSVSSFTHSHRVIYYSCTVIITLILVCGVVIFSMYTVFQECRPSCS